MAIIFNGSTSQLRSTSFGASRPSAYSIACWFSPNAAQSAAKIGNIIFAGNTDIYPNDEGDLSVTWDHVTTAYRGRPVIHYGGTSYTGHGTAGNTSLGWKHWTAVWTGTHLKFFENGVALGTPAAVTMSATAVTNWHVSLGSAPAYADKYTGKICMAGYWPIALLDEESVALGKGVSPLKIRPQSLEYFVPGFRDEKAVVGTTDTTAGLTYDADMPKFLYH